MFVLTVVPSIVQGKETPKLQPYRIEDQILIGTANPNDQLYIYINKALHSVNVDQNGDFSLKLPAPIGPSNVTLFIKDEWGYDESQITYSPKNPPVPLEEKDNITVSYIGLTAENEYYLTTAADATIYALYEGKTYTGQFGLSIPKGTSTEIKAYAKRNNGTKGDSVLLSTKSPTTIKVNPYDFNKKQVSGRSWPYALLELKDGIENVGFTVAKEDGTFTFDKVLTIDELQEEHALSVESGYVPIKSTGILSINKYEATLGNPFYLLVDSIDQEIEGMTFGNTEIQVDGKPCTTSNEIGRFTCSILKKNEPIREITFIKDGNKIGKTLVELSSIIEEFPFQLDQAVTSEYPILSGKTSPNRQFIVSYGIMTLPLFSDSKGMFSLELPRQYTGTFSVALLSLNNQSYDIKSWTIQDERPLLEPTTYTSNGHLILKNRMKGLSELEGEILIEHEDGDMDIQQFTFPKQLDASKESSVSIEGVKPKDRYYLTLRTKEEKPREARFQGTLNPLVKIDLNPFSSYDQELTGKGEPGTHIQIEMPIVYTNSTRTETEMYEGTVAKDGTFVLKKRYPDTSKIRAINYMGWVQVKIERPNSLDNLWYHIELHDDTEPNVKINKLTDNQSTFSLRSDDSLKQLETRYFSKERLVKTDKTEFGWYRFYEIVWDAEKRTSLKQGNITRIEVRGTNSAGLTSKWISVPVLSTTVPPLMANEIFYGDQTVYADTSPNIDVKATYNDITYSAKSNALGRVTFKLKKPIENVGNAVHFTTKSESGMTRVVSKDPIGFPVKDIVLNEDKDKLWFVTQDLRLPLKRYELKLNGKLIKLKVDDSNWRSVHSLPQALKTPVQIELTLRNSNGTIKSTFRKTIKTTYQHKKVTQIVTSTKERTIQGIAQPFHVIKVKDENNLELAYIALNQEKVFKIKANSSLKVGKIIKVYSKDPFGQSSIVQVKIQDDVPPKTPTVSKVTTRSTAIIGKTEPKAMVSINYKKKVYWTKADTKGNYRLKLSSFKAGESIIVYAKDAVGNRSKTVTIRVVK